MKTNAPAPVHLSARVGSLQVSPTVATAARATIRLSYVVASGTSLAIAHMNAMSSRAIAVTATFGCLPRAVSRRKRLQSRTCAFQPRSCSGFGRASIRC